MGVNSLPETVTRQRHGCDLNPGSTAPESSTLKAKFHYTSPTGPARTRTTRISEKLRWSVRVSDKVRIIRWVRSISTCTDFVRGSGRVRDTVGALKKLKHRRSSWYRSVRVGWPAAA